ncbi:MAG: DUF1292 domain-containing protein [Eggerthellaceae bacterium]|nr:DUF1292 domain-containing protein [Eggerthellaceae bacterium]
MEFNGEIRPHDNLIFIAEGDDGGDVVCSVVLTFDYYGNGKSYIVYAVGQDENGVAELQANLYRPDSFVVNEESNQAILEVFPIEDAQDWDIVREALEQWTQTHRGE